MTSPRANVRAFWKKLRRRLQGYNDGVEVRGVLHRKLARLLRGVFGAEIVGGCTFKRDDNVHVVEQVSGREDFPFTLTFTLAFPSWKLAEEVFNAASWDMLKDIRKKQRVLDGLRGQTICNQGHTIVMLDTIGMLDTGRCVRPSGHGGAHKTKKGFTWL